MTATKIETAPYRRLQAWEACLALTTAVYRQTGGWPAAERYGLTAQLRSACVSSLANIAEGSARSGPRQFGRLLDIAVASLAEVGCLIEVASELGLLSAGQSTEVKIAHDHANRLTWGLLKAMRRKAQT